MSRDKRFVALKWCHNNGIIIYPVTDLTAPKYSLGKRNIQKVQIEINNKGKISKDKKWYKQDEELSNKITEYYLFYYDRYNK